MLRRIFEIVLGTVIALSLFIQYGDKTHESKLLIWYVLTPAVLQAITWIALFFLAGRLIFGQLKDYSRFFYNILVKLFGKPKKANQ